MIKGHEQEREHHGSDSAAPALSLPKGGGGLHSIGEKFAANPVTGTGSYRIPLYTTPGRAGFGPELALTYDSGAGNGPFGLGWRLAVPSIARKTEKGLPQYEENTDTFIFSNHEDLVPALDEDQGWALDRFQRTEGTESYTVQRYRPRIETDVMRLELWRNNRTNEMHWRSISRDNVTSIYGQQSSSRVAAPGDDWRTFQWLLEMTYDDKGHLILYEYKAENQDGIDLALPQEQNRLVGPYRYLKRIKYGAQSPWAPGDALPTNWHFEVVFDYGEHDRAIPQVDADAGRTWGCRADPFSTYRPGFELRSYRLCRRVLMFHRFGELGAGACLVRSTDLAYDERPTLSYLTSATVRGYIRNPNNGSYDWEDPQTHTALSPLSMPPLTFTYTQAALDARIHEMDGESLAHLPIGLDTAQYQWVDLDGEGLSGVLAEAGGGWLYKRNLGAGLTAQGQPAHPVALGPAEPVGLQPAGAQLSGGRGQVMDLASDGGRQLVQMRGPVAGYFARDERGGWEPFTPFSSLPGIDWESPVLKWIDLDGDGRADLLLADDERLVWYPSRAREGFGPPVVVRRNERGERLPVQIFKDQMQALFLADMSGDGLLDLVRLRNGEVCYWPNLGYGRFGEMVTMGYAPLFDQPDQFDQSLLRLADIDGSGTTDLIYLGRDGVRIWFNQSGNSWSSPQTLAQFPPVGQRSDVRVADLLGNGTACLVWSSSLPTDARRPLRYIDLMGGCKPHLLRSICNNMGAETQIAYTASTQFYLEDRAAGNPWITRLPFPVYVVTRIEQVDHIAKTRFTTRYRYHHGYYDSPEREFRGFGLVEQWDAEQFTTLDSPPVLTRTWYHTGAYQKQGPISRQYVTEYYQQDTHAWVLPDSLLPENLTAVEEREAYRALKGRILRREIYAEDHSSESQHPYTITEHTYRVRRLQPMQNQVNAVFDVHDCEALDSHNERNPHDPRLTHHLTLALDRYGNVTQSASVAYPRRTPAFPEQEKMAVTVTEHTFANQTNASGPYRIGVEVEESTYELTGLPIGQVDAGALRAAFMSATAIAFDETPLAGALVKRLIARSRHLFYQNDLSGPLALGQPGARALPYESLTLALTPGLVQSAYDGAVDAALLTGEGGYRLLDGGYWVVSGRQIYDAARFYLPVTALDPRGKATSITYDHYALLMTQTTDPLANTVMAQNHYRTMNPWLLTDANANRNAVRYDALGMVTATCVLGKAGLGEADQIDETTAERSPLDQPTTTLAYDLFAWMLHGRPNVLHTRARERHGDPTSPWQHWYSYADGAGHEIMKKGQAEPGLAPGRDGAGVLLRDGAGNLVLVNTAPAVRWIGTGRTIYNNKGDAVKKYEPFFSVTPDYEDEQDLVQWGVTPIFHYDPLGRLVRTEHPSGTLIRTRFGPWHQETWDENDTVTESRWYAERQLLSAGDPERQAADATLPHGGTPGITHLDSLSRAFLHVVDNGAGVQYQTRTVLDIQGHHRAVIDPRGNTVMQQTVDLLSHKLRVQSADAGESRVLHDVMGLPIRAWDSRGDLIRKQYDDLHRLTHLWVKPAGGTEFLAQRTIYGELHPSGAAHNLRQKVYQQYDLAGVITHLAYDCKDNLLQSRRQLARTYKQEMDWAPLNGYATAPEIETHAAALLESEAFSFRTQFDALNRPTLMTRPDQSEIVYTYDPANLLKRVDVRLRGALTLTPLVAAIEHNARGQRVRILYGNGVSTEYRFDPSSLRLTRITSTRAGSPARLQDLQYTFDPVGNVLVVRDGAQQTIFFDNAVVEPAATFVYDALYRLIQAEGREHAGQAAAGLSGYGDQFAAPLPHPNDAQAVRRYRQRYEYDESGNIVAVRHQAGAGSWTRQYTYAPQSNHLLTTTQPGIPGIGDYLYDAHGNVRQMPHLAVLDWNHQDQLRHVDLTGGGHAYYTYDAQGQRVRAVIERLGGLIEERIYLNGYELFRRRSPGSAPELERQTLHIMDDQRRIALIETKTRDASTDVASPQPMIRYQLDNHLGSACLELDASAQVISYEEYHPFGTSAYRSTRSGVEVSARRYRHAGKERDEETGFYYYGARYYAPWLGRWLSCDPAGLLDGANVYCYVQNNPVSRHDPTGMWSWRTVAVVAAVVVVGTAVTVATAGAAGPLVAGAVASVGLTGTAGVVATGVVVGAVAGAAGGAAGELTRQVASGEQVSGRAIARAAVTGAALGAVTGGLGAYASTARGAATIAGVGQRVVPQAVRQAAAATGRAVGSAARAVARVPGVRQVAGVAGGGARAVSRGVAGLTRASTGVGVRATRTIFRPGSAGWNAAEAHAARVAGGNLLRVNTGGLRNEVPLTPQQLARAREFAVRLGMPPEKIVYSEGLNTSYGPLFGDERLVIGTDVLPAPAAPGLSANSRLSMEATLGHELVGHREAHLAGRALVKAGELGNFWLEEAQASYRAAHLTPGLTRLDRQLLLEDAAARVTRFGVTLDEAKWQFFMGRARGQ